MAKELQGLESIAKGITGLKIVLAVVSGLLLTAAFPKIGFSWLAWVALIPLLLAIKGLSPGSAFRLGFITGLIHYLTLLYWIIYTMQTYGGLPLYVCVPVLVLLAAYLALYVAVFGLIITRFCASAWACILIGPVVWVALEYVRAWLFSGFPWGLLGYSQYKALWLIRLTVIIYIPAYVLLSPLENTAGIHWGGRLLLHLYPLMGLLAASALGRSQTPSRRPRPAAVLTALVIMLSIGAQIYSLYLLHERKSFTARLNQMVSARPEKVIIASDWFIPQELGSTFYDKQIFLAKTRAKRALLLKHLQRQGVDRVLLVSARPLSNFNIQNKAKLNDVLNFIAIELGTMILDKH